MKEKLKSGLLHIFVTSIFVFNDLSGSV